MMDYIDMEEGSDGIRYVLMQADKFARIVEFVPAASSKATRTGDSGVERPLRPDPDWIISDGGSHFKNRAMKLLTEQMGINHHITLAYCPWANGAIEIVGKELLWTTRAIISELGYSATDWNLVLPLINYVLNHRGRLSSMRSILRDLEPATSIYIP